MTNDFDKCVRGDVTEREETKYDHQPVGVVVGERYEIRRQASAAANRCSRRPKKLRFVTGKKRRKEKPKTPDANIDDEAGRPAALFRDTTVASDQFYCSL